MNKSCHIELEITGWNVLEWCHGYRLWPPGASISTSIQIWKLEVIIFYLIFIKKNNQIEKKFGLGSV